MGNPNIRGKNGEGIVKSFAELANNKETLPISSISGTPVPNYQGDAKIATSTTPETEVFNQTSFVRETQPARVALAKMMQEISTNLRYLSEDQQRQYKALTKRIEDNRKHVPRSQSEAAASTNIFKSQKLQLETILGSLENSNTKPMSVAAPTLTDGLKQPPSSRGNPEELTASENTVDQDRQNLASYLQDAETRVLTVKEIVAGLQTEIKSSDEEGRSANQVVGPFYMNNGRLRNKLLEYKAILDNNRQLNDEQLDEFQKLVDQAESSYKQVLAYGSARDLHFDETEPVQEGQSEPTHLAFVAKKPNKIIKKIVRLTPKQLEAREDAWNAQLYEQPEPEEHRKRKPDARTNSGDSDSLKTGTPGDNRGMSAENQPPKPKPAGDFEADLLAHLNETPISEEAPPNAAYSMSGTATYGARDVFDAALRAGSLTDTPQYDIKLPTAFKNERPATPAENELEKWKQDKLAEIAAADQSPIGGMYGIKSEQSFLQESYDAELALREIRLAKGEPGLEPKVAPAEAVPVNQAPIEKNFNPDSLSAKKLREANPGITDEQIKVELARRHEAYAELLKNRGQLKENFLPYYQSKNEYRKVYSDQVKGGYEIYKKTNWLGKMFGFHPKNLNSLAAKERLQFIDSRVAYRERLEGIFSGRLNNLPALDRQFVNNDKITAALADRFLIRPARETLKIQKELFPEADRKNIISKFKEVLQKHPKTALTVGALMVGGTIATGGLAGIIPMLVAAISGVSSYKLASKFGVEKSEKTLATALKKASLGNNGVSLAEAEMKLLSADQAVQISKNWRDVIATAGGVAGGMVGGLATAAYPSDVTDGALKQLYESNSPSHPADMSMRFSPTGPVADLGGAGVIESNVGTSANMVGNSWIEPTFEVNNAAANSMSSGVDIASEQPTTNLSNVLNRVGPDQTGRPSVFNTDGFNPIEPEQIPVPEAADRSEFLNDGIPLTLDSGPEYQELGTYIAQPGDNFWDILEGQNQAPQIPTAEWLKVNQPEHYQALIDLVRDAGNADPTLRASFGFGESMNQLAVGQKVDLDLLEYFANHIAEEKGWINPINNPVPDTSTTPEYEYIYEVAKRYA